MSHTPVMCIITHRVGAWGAGEWDPEAAAQAGYAAAFQNQAVRKAFVSKVLFIVFAQLVATAAASAAFYYVHPLKVRLGYI